MTGKAAKINQLIVDARNKENCMWKGFQKQKVAIARWFGVICKIYFIS